jgi:ribosomal protein S10
MLNLNAFTLESTMSMVVGTAKSMGITVSGDAPFLIKKKKDMAIIKKQRTCFEN